MPLQPPELIKPFMNAEERDGARSLLQKRETTLRDIESLANRAFDEWPVAAKTKLPGETNGVPENPKRRVERWALHFAEEISEIHILVNQLKLSDIELRQGLYLAGRLLSTVTGLDQGRVDEFVI